MRLEYLETEMEDNKIGEKEMKKAPVSLSACAIVRERVGCVQVWVCKCTCVYLCIPCWCIVLKMRYERERKLETNRYIGKEKDRLREI